MINVERFLPVGEIRKKEKGGARISRSGRGKVGQNIIEVSGTSWR